MEEFQIISKKHIQKFDSLLKMNADGNLREMTWSPDGRWLLVDLSWNVADEPYAKAMIQVDTGQILPLPELEGTVTDWLP